MVYKVNRPAKRLWVYLNDQPIRKPHDLERFQKDEIISNLGVLGCTFDGELLADDTELRRKDTGVIRISRREA